MAPDVNNQEAWLLSEKIRQAGEIDRLQADNAALRAELAKEKRIPHMDSLDPVLLVNSLEAVNAINTRLEAELAAEKAKVAKGERFREWVTEQLAIAYSHIPHDVYSDRSADEPGENIAIFSRDVKERIYGWEQCDSDEDVCI